MTRDEALAIIDEHFHRCREGPFRSDQLRSALKALLPLCRERWPLDNFWDASGVEHQIGRIQSAVASRNGIYRQLGLPAPGGSLG